MNIPIHQIRWRVVVDGKDHVVTHRQGVYVTAGREWTALCKVLKKQAKRGGVAETRLLLEVAFVDDVKRRYKLPIAQHPDGTMHSPPWCTHKHDKQCGCIDSEREEAVAKNPEATTAAGDQFVQVIDTLVACYLSAYNKDYAAAENDGATDRRALDYLIEVGCIPMIAA